MIVVKVVLCVPPPGNLTRVGAIQHCAVHTLYRVLIDLMATAAAAAGGGLIDCPLLSFSFIIDSSIV